jgi:hypothetical protein
VDDVPGDGWLEMLEMIAGEMLAFLLCCSALGCDLI